MAESLCSQPCRLLTLPTEVKLSVVNYLDSKRDLYNLSQTCRVLEDVVMSQLYHDFSFELSQDKVPSFREPVTQSVRRLTIRNGRSQRRNSVYKRRRLSDAGSIKGRMNGVLDKIPQQRLLEVGFFHQTPLSPQTLDFLARQHGTTLQGLSFYDLEPFSEFISIPRHLSSLDARSVNEGAGIEKIISLNKQTLQRLSLGQEKELILRYQQCTLGALDHIHQPSESFFKTVYLLESLPKLRELSLSGLDVSHLRPASIPSALFFCQLEKLTLESCPNSEAFLESIAGTFHWTTTSPDAPQNPPTRPLLKHFLFRHENPTTALKDALIRFLTSFGGLRTLSLLFENGTVLERPGTFIAEHGPTLEALVLESRIQPRGFLSLDTSRPFGVGGYGHELWEQSINDVARLCPNLVELGTGFPWNDEIVRLRKTALPTLQHLRTIHIRNFPENQAFSQIGDYTIKEYATKFIEWVFPPLTGGSRPSLTHLAIGPTIYESRWKITPQPPQPQTPAIVPSTTPGTFSPFNVTTLRSPTTRSQTQSQVTPRSQPPEFLRTHHFCLDWAKTRFNRWSPLVTPVSEKFMEEITGQTPLKGVFEQVWLR